MSKKGFLTPARDGILLNLRVSPGAKRTSIEGPYGENALKLRVASPPVDGKANAEVESFLAESLGVRGSNVAVIRGTSSRDKVVLVRGVEAATVREILTGSPR
ncbi:MAG: DUF167 domain-containing protein [Actinomycetota bacterium]|nr:YggU family protein [Rubrobacter sp.]MDQ3590147.1 DUF167 domain-containing protein [Actinomycetota bacterium]MDQ5811243.1 DUF167 domain-containing protein [Actinomycetota bacterium]MDQ5818659.1 DUF167 domain-containing protein [Actinomycetota bacterium]